MLAGRTWKPVALIVVGLLIMLVAGLMASGKSVTTTIALCVGAGVTLSSLVFIRQITASTDPDTAAGRLRQQQEEFENLRQRVGSQLEEQTARLERRQRELARRFLRFHEFLEYPDPGEGDHLESRDVVRLSEQDRKVQDLLEAEAQRVYEKIRANGYWARDRVDVDAIRQEIFELVQHVARVYAPESANPLLETSFEQLARAASRVCLHLLVVLEQLPLDVQQYNFNALYSYVRRAVSGYGAYQKAAPWLTYLSRGAYVGRFAAGANPLTIGAWWLASEIGKRGATRFVENVVDRQAIAVLHDVVTVLGVEISNIYGPGNRQRSPAWVLGTEITELTQRFPLSRDSLKEALRQVTTLPLKSEYDRIYLYRCLAEHRAAGLRISDPAMLTREEREQVAKQLEHFFAEFIHGVKDKDVTRWREDVEHRLDLKLSLTGHRPKQASPDDVRQCVESIHAFLTSVTGRPPDQAVALLEQTAIVRRLSAEQRTAMFQALAARDQDTRFEPPDLDPSDDLTEVFLRDLVHSVVNSGQLEPSIESLLVETGAYFRRTAIDMQALIDAAAISRFQDRSAPDAPLADVEGHAARLVLNVMQPDEVISGYYTGVTTTGDASMSVAEASLVCLRDHATESCRVLLLHSDAASSELWSSDATIKVVKKDGFLIDDCVITGGRWNGASGDSANSITVSGVFRGGGYEKWFAPVIEVCDHMGKQDH